MPTFKDITGNKYGKLLVLERDVDYVSPQNRRRIQYKCLCDCGNIVTIIGENLRGNKTLSCGCYQKEKAKKAKITHNSTNSRLYGIWCSMKSRCFNANNKNYNLYGGRGIVVCKDWLDFVKFREWAYASGYDSKAPRGVCTLDRIDVNGNYCPENCRWVSQMIQANNTRTNKIIEYNGEKHTIAEWGRITGINPSKIENRIVVLCWPIEKALTIK